MGRAAVNDSRRGPVGELYYRMGKYGAPDSLPRTKGYYYSYA